MRSLIRLFMIAAALVVARPALAVDDCAMVSMTVSSQVSSDPGFAGLHKYTVTGTWDVTRFVLGHIDFFLTLKDLECICDPRVIKFGTPAGTSDGEALTDPCTVLYAGKYNCEGDPSVPAELRAPTIKFDAVSADCVPGVTGTGTWVFYSPFPPAPYSVDPAGVAIKHGLQVCLGPLAGTMPMGDCSTPAHSASWGGVKAIYR